MTIKHIKKSQCCNKTSKLTFRKTPRTTELVHFSHKCYTLISIHDIHRTQYLTDINKPPRSCNSIMRNPISVCEKQFMRLFFYFFKGADKI